MDFLSSKFATVHTVLEISARSGRNTSNERGRDSVKAVRADSRILGDGNAGLAWMRLSKATAFALGNAPAGQPTTAGT